MKIPISRRLLTAASLVSPGARVADIGCDHGFLGIWLIASGISPFVIASDLREKPLESARQNAKRFRTEQRMQFVCADGLDGIAPGAADTVVCCGMGGDLIVSLIENKPWLRNGKTELILQAQSGLPDLRQWLADNGFLIVREIPVQDHRFLYSVMLVRYDGERRTISAGERFVSPAMLREDTPLVKAYWQRMVRSVEATLKSFENTDQDGDKREQFRLAAEDLKRMGECL